jgi:16S rRNA (guanine(966)-N(2))-methyltransferase RsmD
MALEALSRGASYVVMVDHHPAALRLIGRNLAICGNPQNAKVYRLDLRRGLKPLIRQGRSFDLVLLDPPYGRGLNQRCLEQLGNGALLKPNATVVSEHAIGENLTAAYGCLQLQSTRRYGGTALSFYRRGNE